MALIYNVLLLIAQSMFVAYDITYFKEAGLSLALITLASSGFDISSVIAELPTSLFFDRISPRYTLAAGNVIRLTGFILFALFPQNFALVLVGQIMTGIGTATETGTASALYINERKEEESSFQKIMGEMMEYSSISYVVGGLLGALCYWMYPPLIWIVPAVIYAGASLLLMRMRMNWSEASEESEPSAQSADSNSTTSSSQLAGLARDFWDTTLSAVKNEYWWMCVLLNAGSLSMYFLWQIRLGGYTTQVWNQYGALIVFNIAGYLAGVVTAKVAFSHAWLIPTVLGVNVALCIALAWTDGYWLGLAFYLPHVILLGWLNNYYGGHVHMSITDNQRATTFSLMSAIGALAAAIVGPVCGWLADNVSLAVGMTSSLVIFVIPITWTTCQAITQKKATTPAAMA